jgi:hypothetical protein
LSAAPLFTTVPIAVPPEETLTVPKSVVLLIVPPGQDVERTAIVYHVRIIGNAGRDIPGLAIVDGDGAHGILPIRVQCFGLDRDFKKTTTGNGLWSAGRSGHSAALSVPSVAHFRTGID